MLLKSWLIVRYKQLKNLLFSVFSFLFEEESKPFLWPPNEKKQLRIQ